MFQENKAHQIFRKTNIFGEFFEIFMTNFFNRTPLVAASVDTLKYCQCWAFLQENKRSHTRSKQGLIVLLLHCLAPQLNYDEEQTVK